MSINIGDSGKWFWFSWTRFTNKAYERKITLRLFKLRLKVTFLWGAWM